MHAFRLCDGSDSLSGSTTSRDFRTDNIDDTSEVVGGSGASKVQTRDDGV